MQPPTQLIATVFAEETQLDVMIKTGHGQPLLEIDERQPVPAADRLVPFANRFDFNRGVPYSALHD